MNEALEYDNDDCTKWLWIQANHFLYKPIRKLTSNGFQITGILSFVVQRNVRTAAHDDCIKHFVPALVMTPCTKLHSTYIPYMVMVMSCCYDDFVR